MCQLFGTPRPTEWDGMSQEEKAFDARYGDAWRENEQISPLQALSYLTCLGAAAIDKVTEKIKARIAKRLTN